MFNNLGTAEVLIVSFILLGLFGSKKMKKVAGDLGKAKKEFDKTKEEAMNMNLESIVEDNQTDSSEEEAA